MTKRKISALLCLLCFVTGLVTGCAGKDSGKKLNQEGRKAYEKQNYEEAVQKLEQATAMEPENAEYQMNYGFALIAQQKTKAAVGKMKEAIALSKSEKEDDMEIRKLAYRGIGIAYFEAGNYQKAASNFTKALGHDGSVSINEDILSYRADTYIGLGDYEKAAADYRKVLEENKKAADIYAKIGELYRKMGDLEGALLEYDEAIQLDSDNPEYYIGTYYLLDQMGRTAEMSEVLDTAMEKCDGGKIGIYNSGYLLFVKKDYAAAEINLQKAKEDGISEANYYLGEIAQMNGDIDTAIAYYRQCVSEENEKTAKAYNQLAAISIQLGNYEEASGFIKQGLSYHDLTVRRELKINEIIICEQKRYWVKAREKAEALQKLYPGDEEISRELDFLKTRAKK